MDSLTIAAAALYAQVTRVMLEHPQDQWAAHLRSGDLESVLRIDEAISENPDANTDLLIGILSVADVRDVALIGAQLIEAWAEGGATAASVERLLSELDGARLHDALADVTLTGTLVRPEVAGRLAPLVGTLNAAPVFGPESSPFADVYADGVRRWQPRSANAPHSGSDLR